MTFRILIVCAANLCRSPLAAAAFERVVAQQGLEDRITIDSGGIDPPPGHSVCPEIVRLAASRGLHSRSLPHHVARPVSVAQLAAADLVLATDRRVRSELVKRTPYLAGRTFTLREAADLADLVAGELRGQSLSRRLTSFAATMNATRGFTELPRTRYVVPLPAPWRRVAVHAHDIPDAHQIERAPHRVVYRLTVTAAEHLAHDLGAATTTLAR